MYKTTAITSIRNYCKDSFCFVLLACGLIEKIEPTPKISVPVVMYCEFSRIFNNLLVFLDDGYRILAGLRLNLISIKFSMGVILTLLKKNSDTHIAYISREEFRGWYILAHFRT